MGRIFTIVETARRFGMTEQAMRDWIRKGYIKVHEVGRARYIDEDTILALQDTAEDIRRQQAKLEALRNEIRAEYDYMRHEHDDEKDRRRYVNMMTGAAFRSGFFGTMVHLMQVYGDLTEKEATILTEYLNGMTMDAIALSFKITRERVRQIVAKAIRKSENITHIEERINQMNDLQADNMALKNVVAGLKDKLSKYELQEKIDTEKDEEKKRQIIIDNDRFCKLLSTNLRDCDISTRAFNVTRTIWTGSDYIDIETIGDLCRLTPMDILKQRNAGKVTLNELTDFLHRMNLDWGMDVDKIYKERIENIMKG